MSLTIPPLEIVSAKDLLTQPVIPIKFTIDKILPHGLFILSGVPKAGKSFLVLDMSACIINGKPFWSYKTTQGDVLYFALEDNHSRLQERLGRIAPDCNLDIPADIHFVTKARRLDYGLPEQIGEFLDAHPKTSLIIIDTLQYVRKGGKNTGTYFGDYNDMDTLREILYGRDLSMIVITHNHKPEDTDPLNRVYGSAGLTGAVDGIFVLEKHKRTGDKAKLIITNRDTESRQFEIMFNSENCRWEFLKEIRDDEGNEEIIFGLIKTFLYEIRIWKGTPTELCEKLKTIDENLHTSPVALSKILKSNQEYLAKKYHVIYAFARNSSERLIELKLENLKGDNEETAKAKMQSSFSVPEKPEKKNTA